MKPSSIRRAAAWFLLPLAALQAQHLASAVFLEPVGKIDTNRAEVKAAMPIYRRVADPSKYLPWLDNESAKRALRLYRAGYEVAHPTADAVAKPDYYVALVPGGNHAAVGFRIQHADGSVEDHPKQAYILLDAEPDAFVNTLLHETGHVVMAMLAGGRQLDGKDVSAIPHTTAALSDRGTAFSEGYAIHLETLAAHLNHDPYTHERYHRGQVLFGGEGSFKTAEYFHQSHDLATFSQTVARYLEVRDNGYAFEPAFQGPDYLRVQMEKARDFAAVRNANQLLQSEGFYASFFFLWTIRGASVPQESAVAERERRIMVAMRAMFDENDWDSSSPWLIRLVTAYIKQFPEQKTALADALDDLSHGVFVDPDAARVWKDHYLGALHLDKQGMNVEAITALRKKWRESVVADPRVLYSRVGPELPCTLPGSKVRLAAFEEDSPVVFDLNTAPAGILRLVPGITEPEITSWIEQRGKRPFSSIDDFKTRVGLRPSTLAALQFSH